MNRIVLARRRYSPRAGPCRRRRPTCTIGSRAPYTVNQPLNAYSWAGPYLGGNLGYAWGSSTTTRPSRRASSGGVQAGYNWQNGPWVFGLEGDIQATGAERYLRAVEILQPVVRHGARPGRLRLQQHPVLRHRRSGVRRTARPRPSACRNPTPMPAGPSASAPNSASRRTGAPRSNISTSISPTATSAITGASNGYRFGLVRAGVNYHF